MNSFQSSPLSSPSTPLLDYIFWKYHVFISFNKDTNEFVHHLLKVLYANGLNTAQTNGLLSQWGLENCKICIIVLSKGYIYDFCPQKSDELSVMARRKSELYFLPIYFKVDPSEVMNIEVFNAMAEEKAWLETTLLTQPQDLVVRRKVDWTRVIAEAAFEALKIVGPLTIATTLVQDRYLFSWFRQNDRYNLWGQKCFDMVAKVQTLINTTQLTQHQDLVKRDKIDQRRVIAEVVSEALKILDPLKIRTTNATDNMTENFLRVAIRFPKDFHSSMSSSSSSTQISRSDVFLSFSCQNTSSFVQFLKSALKRNDLTIDTSWYSIPRGASMEDYKIYMVVFSKHYVPTRSSLYELAAIAECIHSPGHILLPIFFEVDPSEVLDSYFLKHIQDFELDILQVVKVHQWLASTVRQDFIVRHKINWRPIIAKIVMETLDILCPITMATTNMLSSSSKQMWRSDVFVSFSSEDTSSFVQWLLDALNRNDLKISSSMDSIRRRSIEEYKIHMVIFSKNYAPSVAYLEELATIVECMNSLRHSFLPVFFEANPSEVLSSYFLKHLQESKLDLGKVVKVHRLLATIQRQDLVVRHGIDQRQVIDQIVEETIKTLGRKAFRLANRIMIKVTDQAFEKMDISGRITPIGIHSSRVQKLMNLLDLGSIDHVQLVGLCGMGGIGKSTLARELFNKISHLFDSTCFLTNASEYDFILEEAILCATLKEGYIHQVDNIHSSLRLHKVLIVLDDVDNLGPLKDLVGNRHWFRDGSRIIIITRDEHILRRLGVDQIHKVELLNKNEARRLFCKTVFKCGYPMRGYEEFTFEALEYANGLPLAIKLLGSLLPNRSVSECQSVLAKLKIIPDSSIFMALKKSFDGLCKKQKEIFLDIACCFTGENISYVKEILNSHYGLFCVEETFRTLIDRSLTTILAQRIQMHNLIQQMGKEIVRQESTALERRSRLWNYDDFRQVMENTTGTKFVKIIALLRKEGSQELPLSIDGLSQMSNLRVLIFRNMNVLGRLDRLSNKLQYLSWQKCPFPCLPSNFRPRQLVELILPDSSITQLWGGRKVYLPMLRNLNLCGSKYLMKLPSFVYVPNLERLDLEECTSILQLDLSITSLPRLKSLNLRKCTNLDSIPNNLFGQSSLEFLNLAGCSKFAECLIFNKRLNKLPPIILHKV